MFDLTHTSSHQSLNVTGIQLGDIRGVNVSPPVMAPAQQFLIANPLAPIDGHAQLAHEISGGFNLVEQLSDLRIFSGWVLLDLCHERIGDLAKKSLHVSQPL